MNYRRAAGLGCIGDRELERDDSERRHYQVLGFSTASAKFAWSEGSPSGIAHGALPKLGHSTVPARLASGIWPELRYITVSSQILHHILQSL